MKNLKCFVLVRYPPKSYDTNSARIGEAQLRLRIKRLADLLDVIFKFRFFEKFWRYGVSMTDRNGWSCHTSDICCCLVSHKN